MSEVTVTIRLSRAQAQILMQLFSDRIDAIREPVKLPESQTRVMQECLRQAKSQMPKRLAELP